MSILFGIGGGVSDHGGLTGLSDDDHTIYALLLGRSGGQTLIGGTAASNNLTLQSTSNATRGVILGNDTFSSPGAGASSERYGASAVAAGASSLALGNAASSASANGIAIGASCSTGTGTTNLGIGKSLTINNGTNNCIAIGHSLSVPTGCASSIFLGLAQTISSGATGCTLLGSSITCTGNNAVAIGYLANVSAENFSIGFTSTATGGTRCMSLGNFCQATPAGGYSMCVGDSAKSDQIGTMVFGDYDNRSSGGFFYSSNAAFFGWATATDKFYFGNFAVSEVPPADWAFISCIPTATEDSTGGNVWLHGGLSTGASAISGRLILSSGEQAGAATLQTLFTALEVTAKVSGGANASVVFNEDGRSDLDFRGEGDTDANLFFIDSSADAIQIGGTAPTAFLHLKAGTTAKATARFPASTAPTSPNEGDTWNDSTQKTFHTFTAGIKQAAVGCIYSSTASATVANTVTETTIVGSGVGTVTLPANFFTAGKTIRLRMTGIHSSVSSATIQIRIKLGSTTILDTGAHTSHNDTNALTNIEAIITCRTTGASGTFIGQGEYVEVGASPDIAEMVNTTTTVVSTTASQTVAVTAQWGSASASNTITITNFTLEVLN